MKKTVAALFSVICFVPTFVIPVSAEQINSNDVATTYSAGLINTYHMSISSSNRDVYISAETYANDTMK